MNAPADQHVIKKEELLEMLSRHPNAHVVIEDSSKLGYIDCVSYSQGMIRIHANAELPAHEDIAEMEQKIEDLESDLKESKEEVEDLEDEVEENEKELSAKDEVIRELEQRIAEYERKAAA